MENFAHTFSIRTKSKKSSPCFFRKKVRHFSSNFFAISAFSKFPCLKKFSASSEFFPPSISKEKKSRAFFSRFVPKNATSFFSRFNQKKTAAFFSAVIAFFIATFFFSCRTTHLEAKIPEPEPQPEPQPHLRLAFAGDVMAHTQNFSVPNFAEIWEDVAQELLATDFAFMNLEAPVVPSMPFKSYPSFNMRPPYPQAAFDAGFNLISLANNHTDDQNPAGILETQKWALEVSKNSLESKRPIYFSGLTEKGEFSFCEILWNEKKILFIAMTELLNTWRDYDKVNFTQPSVQGRSQFCERVKKMKEEFSPHLFIVSVHTSEEEYVSSVLPAVKKFYFDLLDAGADIVVSNHPHVVRAVEFVGEEESKKIRKAIMYANGNTISGQRRSLNYERPLSAWERTGEGQIVFFECDFDEKGFFILEHETILVTAYPPKLPLVKKLDENFIKKLEDEGKKNDAAYFRTRLDSIKKEEIFTWQ